jgi:hypothetical protein
MVVERLFFILCRVASPNSLDIFDCIVDESNLFAEWVNIEIELMNTVL